jgi:hypothetical protein
MENPYQSPMASVSSSGVPGARPSGFTAVCVIAIVLGGLGLLGSFAAIVSLAAGPRLQEAMTPKPQGRGNDRVIEMQRTMQQRVQAVTDRYWWPNAGFALLNVGLAGGMLSGGIMALNRVPRARTILIAVFSVALLFEVFRTIVYIFMQWEMAAVMSEMLPRMMEATAPRNAPNPQQAAAIAATAAKVGIVVGLAFTLIFSVAKLVYYAVGRSYFNRPAVRQWLQNADEGWPMADGGIG